MHELCDYLCAKNEAKISFPTNEDIKVQLPLTFGESSTDLVPAALAIPIWSETHRGFPLSFAVSSLFTASNAPERKQYPKLEPLVSADVFEVWFSGEELREETDRAVWCQLMHLARGRFASPEFPIDVHFTGNEFLNALGWQSNSRSYARLSDCLDRLQKAQVVLRVKKNGRTSKRFVMSFISNVTTGIKLLSGKSKWVVRLDHMAADIFSTGNIVINVEQRQQLSRTLSKKMLDQLVATDKDDFSAKVGDLLILFGSETRSLAAFKQNLKSALEELREAKVLTHFAFTDDVLYVTKTGATAVNRGTPKSLNIHKAPAMQIDDV